MDAETEEETCTLTSITFSKHRLIPHKRYSIQREDGTSRGVLHPTILLEHGLETIFADPETSALITDILRTYSMVLHEADAENNGVRYQPLEDDPGRSECIDTALNESFQIASFHDIALEIMSLRGCGERDRNCIVEGIQQLVRAYEDHFEERNLDMQDVYRTLANHIAYALQQPPAFTWYIHPSKDMVVKGRRVLFYRLDGVEGLPPSEENDGNLQFTPLPGPVAPEVYEACQRASEELKVIVNKFVLEPESKRIEVIVGEVGDAAEDDDNEEDGQEDGQ